MLVQLSEGALLVALNVAIHSTVLGWTMWRLQQAPVVSRSALSDAWLLGRIAILCVLAHLAEITVWAMFYWLQDVMPGLEIAFYFSAVTYATIGYGDITPPENWRLLASIEGLTGILMCAWSGGFFFAIVKQLQESSSSAKHRA
jgi:hypothetical protein